MRTSIILGLKHGSKEIKLVSGPLRPDLQNTKFKELLATDGAGWSQIHLHEITLNAGRKRQVFRAKLETVRPRTVNADHAPRRITSPHRPPVTGLHE
jgi:hypothetical protein